MSRALFAFAALCAALFSHVVLDVVGDYWLTTDAYDNVAHTSREAILAGASALAVAILWRALAAALRELEGRPGALRTVLRAAVPRSPGAFVAGVALATGPLVAGMGALDGLLDDGRLDTLATCLGGSIPLGVCTSLLCAALVGAIIWKLGRVLGMLDDALLRWVQAVVHRSRRPRTLTFVRRHRAPFRAFAVVTVAQSRGLRAPPSQPRR